MSNSFYAPTRIVHGLGALKELPGIVKRFGARHPIVVTDQVIAATPFFAEACRDLAAAGLDIMLFDRCEIDARLAHVDAGGSAAKNAGIDCVIGIGGGSVLCCAKGIAAVVTNGASYRQFRGGGAKPMAHRPLPNVLVPTTAGAGTEVSQHTVIYDEANHVKIVISSPLAFPDVAVLDPATLATLPQKLGAASVIDAATHAIEAYLATTATPVTDAYATTAIRMLVHCARRSVIDKEAAAMADNHLAASMANIAFGNCGVGMAHVLGGPLESAFHMTHGVAVGVMLARVAGLAAHKMPDRAAWLVEALGGKPTAKPTKDGPAALAAAVRARLFALYDTVGFPRFYDRAVFDAARIDEMMRNAYVASMQGRATPEDVTETTIIASASGIALTAAEVRSAYADCLGL